MSGVTHSVLAAAGAASGVAAAVAPGLLGTPDLRLFIFYGGYSVAVAVTAALWREDLRTPLKALRLAGIGFLVGGAVGVAWSEFFDAPNVAMAAALLMALVLPQFIETPMQTIRDLKALIFNGGKK